MFWYLWFPLIGLVLTILIGLYIIWKNDDMDMWGFSILYGLVVGLIFFMVGSLIAISNTNKTPPAAIVPESETPTYLVSLTGDEKLSGKFIWASGSFSQNDTLKYYFYLPGTEKIVFKEVIASSAIIVEDDPVKPYFNKLIAVCPPDTFWRRDCNTSIEYNIEFHIPKGSIYRDINITP